jgi:hypothetical protein
MKEEILNLLGIWYAGRLAKELLITVYFEEADGATKLKLRHQEYQMKCVKIV